MDSTHFSPYRSDGKLYGFVCVIIGSDQPIGRAVVRELASHGAACIYACSESGKSNASKVAEDYANCKILDYPFRAANEEDTLALIDDVLNTWGRLDIWTTTHPCPTPTPLSTTSPTTLLQTLSTHALAPFLALKYAPPAMQKLCSKGSYPNATPKDQGYGSIIVISSVAGQGKGVAHTVASHAALGVVKAGGAELRGGGVRVNCISAGRISDELDSEFYVAGASAPSQKEAQVNGGGRVGLPGEVARVAGFLASGFSSYVNGSNIVVDGGASVV